MKCYKHNGIIVNKKYKNNASELLQLHRAEISGGIKGPGVPVKQSPRLVH